MKTKKFALLIILSMLVTGFAGADSYIVEDDIYYNPNDKNPVVEKKEKEAQKELQEKAAVKKTLMATSDNHFRDVDEYNRRGESSDMTLEDIAANQKEDYVEYNVVDENGDDGYYLNGFNGSDSDYPWLKNLLIALGSGVVIALLIVEGMRRSLKSVKMQRSAENYVRAGSIQVTRRQDHFLYTRTSKSARPKNNSGSSGSSTHTSSSGTSHGGGGGKF